MLPALTQDMLAGEKELIGNGNIRDVYLVKVGDKTLVVKALRDDFEQRASKQRADKIHRWEAAALDAVSAINRRNGMFPRSAKTLMRSATTVAHEMGVCFCFIRV